MAAGHAVVAVDESAEMLASVQGAETAPADVWHLDLGRRPPPGSPRTTIWRV